MRVLKFGGTSVASAQRLRSAAEIVVESATRGRVVVVVSALSGVTDQLVAAVADAVNGSGGWRGAVEDLANRHLNVLGELGGSTDGADRTIGRRLVELERVLAGIELLGECPDRSSDTVLAAGERLSACLLKVAVEACGWAAETVDGSEVIRAQPATDEVSVNRQVTAELVATRLGALHDEVIPVVTGFVAGVGEGRTITLGRGGSDLSATVLGAALKADAVEIWTDVSGVMSAPPKLVRGARPLATLSVDEAAELAHFGAKVLHRRCLQPLVGLSIPVLIRNSLDPGGSFSVIRDERSCDVGVRAVAAVEHATVVELGNSAKNVENGEKTLSAVHDLGLVSCRAPAGPGWTVVLPSEAAEAVELLLSRNVPQVAMTRKNDVSLVAMVGGALLNQPWTVGRALEALARHQVEVRGVFAGGSQHSVSLLVDRNNLVEALDVIHESLMLGRRAEAALVRHERAAREVRNEPAKDQGGHPGCHRQRRSEARQPAL